MAAFSTSGCARTRSFTAYQCTRAASPVIRTIERHRQDRGALVVETVLVSSAR
jgi:hypothetical protein